MNKLATTMAEQIAEAACDFQRQQTGHECKAVRVVLSEDTLVITLEAALTPAERDLASTPAGSAKLQEFHRQLFATSVDGLRQTIKRITGVAVREAVAQVETNNGTVAQIFSSGTMVQVFQLAHPISPEAWHRKL